MPSQRPGAYSDGRPKGLPYPISEGFLENRRGGAEGESAEGREKPPWGVPLRKQHGRNHIRRRGDPCGRLVLPVRILAGAPRGSPTQTRKASLKPVGEGLAPSAGRTGPYEIETASGYAVGAAPYGRPFWRFPPPPCRARRPRRAAGGGLHLPVGPGFPDAPPPPHNLSPTRPKGALPTNRSTARRLPDTQRQRS